MRILKGLFILLLGFGTLSSPFIHGPYTGDPSEDAVTVSWTMEPPLRARVEYAPYDRFTASGDFTAFVEYEPGRTSGRETVHVRLKGLEGGAKYAYRVVLYDDASEHQSPVGTFHTAPPPGTPVAFAVISDTQWRNWTHPNRIELVGDALAADPTPFQFILHSGDVVEHPFRKYWDHLFASLSEALLRAPLIPVLGNHERGHRSYYDYFDLPPGGGKYGERWWALHWGDIVVVGLDSNVRDPEVYGEQVTWLREHLSGPEPHKFVVFHHPVFTSDSYYGPGSPGLEALWHPVFVEYGVDVVFNGHAHNYERIVRDGITYLVVGGAGGPRYPLSGERVEGSVVGDDRHHFYVRVFTSPEGIRVEVVQVARVEGDEVVPVSGLLDSFELPAD